MTDWMKNNFNLGNMLTIVVLLAGLFAIGVRVEYSDRYQSQQLADIEQRLRAHLADRAIHIDPDRDERRWRDVYAYLERIEKKIDASR